MFFSDSEKKKDARKKENKTMKRFNPGERTGSRKDQTKEGKLIGAVYIYSG